MADALMVGTNPSNLHAIPNPTDISWGLSDISSADAGRTNDAGVTMHKNLVARKRKLQLTWKNLDGYRTADVLQAFMPEYVYVRYHDPASNEYQVRQFYSGDKTAPVHSMTIGGIIYKTVNFNIIER